MYLAFSKFSAGLWIGTVTGWKVRVSFSMSILNLIISSADSSWNDRAYFSKDDKWSRKIHVYKPRPKGAWERWQLTVTVNWTLVSFPSPVISQRYLGFPCPNCIVQGAGFWPSLEESIPKVCTHILYPLLTFPEQRELWVQRAWKTLYKIGQTYAWLPHTGWWAIFFQKKNWSGISAEIIKYTVKINMS